MRDFASCFSEHAVKVSDTSCSGSSSSGKSTVVATDRSVQTSVSSLYRTHLSANKDVLITVTWCETHTGPVLSLGVDEDPKHHHRKPDSIGSHALRRRKGTRSYVSGTSVVGLYWDYSASKFNSSPEPVSNFYAVVTVDEELALLLGDLSVEFVKKFYEAIPVVESSLVGRREEILWQSAHSTRARFGDGGKDHDIVIKCKSGIDSMEPELVVSIDKKRVVQARRLQWNFRGNQTIFVDGVPVDMMWDVGNWLSSSPPGCAVFMFRRRSALQSRLWLEEEMLYKERGISGFSLLVRAFKNP